MIDMLRIFSILFFLYPLTACDLGSEFPGGTDDTGDESSETGDDEEASDDEDTPATKDATQNPDETLSEEQESDTPDVDESKSETVDSVQESGDTGGSWPTIDPLPGDSDDDSGGGSTSTSTTSGGTTTTTTGSGDESTDGGGDTTSDTTGEETVEPDRMCFEQCWLELDQEFADIQRKCGELDTCPRENCIQKSWSYRYHGIGECADDCHLPPEWYTHERCLAGCSDEFIECKGNSCSNLDCLNEHRICRGQC